MHGQNIRDVYETKQGRKSRTQFSHTDLYVFIQKLYFKKCALTFHNINKVTIS